MSIVAAIQMTSGPDVEANLTVARGLLERARTQGALLAALPENFAIRGRSEADKLAVAETSDARMFGFRHPFSRSQHVQMGNDGERPRDDGDRLASLFDVVLTDRADQSGG